MSKEKNGKILQAMAAFYNWSPEEAKEGYFNCYHIEPYPMMSEKMCKMRATKPHIYTSCSNSCPRWKYYRKLHKKELAKNLPPRRPYPLKGEGE